MPKNTVISHSPAHSTDNEFPAVVAAYARDQKISQDKAAIEMRRFISTFNQVLSAGEEVRIPDTFWSNGHLFKGRIRYCIVKKLAQNHLTITLG